MYDMGVQPTALVTCTEDPSWNESPPSGCGDPVAAQVFMFSYTLFVSFIMMNLFVAVVLGAQRRTRACVAATPE